MSDLSLFSIRPHPLSISDHHAELVREDCGGYVIFEGRVRNHHQGKPVSRLSYQAYEELAVTEGTKLVAEICEKFDVHATAVHAVGDMVPGDLVVWVGVSAGHREAAFTACGELISQIKERVPIWKQEHYPDGPSEWLRP